MTAKDGLNNLYGQWTVKLLRLVKAIKPAINALGIVVKA